MGSTASHSTNHSALGGKCRLGHRRFLEREGCPPDRPWESSARARLHRYDGAGSWGILCCWGGHLARTPPLSPLPQVLPAHAPCHGGAPMKPSASLSAGKSRGHAGPRALPCVLPVNKTPPSTAHGAEAGRQGSAVQRPETDIPFTRCRKNTRGPDVKHAVQDFLGCMFSYR